MLKELSPIIYHLIQHNSELVPVDACAGPGVREKYAAKHLKSVCGQIWKAGWPIWPDASRGGSYPMPDLAQFEQELRIIKKAANSVLFQQ